MNRVSSIVSRQPTFTLELAQPEDDGALRAILAATPMPGPISLCLTREPNYFSGSSVEGPFRQTIVARDRLRGQVVGMGSRSVSMVYMNGKPSSLGYLSGLRVLPEHRRGTLLARGYRFLQQLHKDNRTPLYVTTIAAGNRETLSLLTSGRGPLPKYHAMGQYHTLILSRRMADRGVAEDGVDIRAASTDDLPRLVAFWNEVGSKRQFFPVLSADDLVTPEALYRDLRLEQILVAWRDGHPCGTLALWDQSSFRQTVVTGMPTWLRVMRPVYNWCARIRDRPRLPGVGQAVSYGTAALLVIRDDEVPVLHGLLAAANQRWALAQQWFLAFGLHNSDPLLPEIRRLRTLEYVTQVYLACWDDGESLRQSLDQRPFYLELGRL